jgi:hypothetical protein
MRKPGRLRPEESPAAFPGACLRPDAWPYDEASFLDLWLDDNVWLHVELHDVEQGGTIVQVDAGKRPTASLGNRERHPFAKGRLLRLRQH